MIILFFILLLIFLIVVFMVNKSLLALVFIGIILCVLITYFFSIGRNKKSSKVKIDITENDMKENKELVTFDKKYRNDARIAKYIEDIITNEYKTIKVYPDHFEFDEKQIDIISDGFDRLSVLECFVISDIFDDKVRSYIDYDKNPLVEDDVVIGHSLIKK